MKIICITNRHLCKTDFFEQIEHICKRNLYALILREKDLNDKTYEEFAVKCNDICKKHNILFFINTKINIAQQLNIKNIQLSFKDFLDNKNILSSFDNVAVSVHSLQEAEIVEDWKIAAAMYDKSQLRNKQTDYRMDKSSRNDKPNLFLIAGHIFETECKKGLQPRGTKFLKEICDNIKIQVFAIGGINEKTVNQLKDINIEGVCLMSLLMENIPKTIFKNFNSYKNIKS